MGLKGLLELVFLFQWGLKGQPASCFGLVFLLLWVFKGKPQGTPHIFFGGGATLKNVTLRKVSGQRLVGCWLCCVTKRYLKIGWISAVYFSTRTSTATRRVKVDELFHPRPSDVEAARRAVEQFDAHIEAQAEAQRSKVSFLASPIEHNKFHGFRSGSNHSVYSTYFPRKTLRINVQTMHGSCFSVLPSLSFGNNPRSDGPKTTDGSSHLFTRVQTPEHMVKAGVPQRSATRTLKVQGALRITVRDGSVRGSPICRRPARYVFRLYKRHRFFHWQPKKQMFKEGNHQIRGFAGQLDGCFGSDENPTAFAVTPEKFRRQVTQENHLLSPLPSEPANQ